MQLLDRLVGTGDVGEGRLRGVLGDQLGLAWPKLITRLPPPCTWLITKNSTPTISRIGSRLTSRRQPAVALGDLGVEVGVRRHLGAVQVVEDASAWRRPGRTR